MTGDDLHTTRRNVLRGVTVGAGLGGLSTPVLGRPDDDRGSGGSRDDQDSDGGRVSLVDGHAEFRLYVADGPGSRDGGSDEPDRPGQFGYPHAPAMASEDPPGGLFDASEMEKTPNGGTLHHSLQFFNGFLMRRSRGKPYVLVGENGGRFRARGQHVNFEARTTAELKALFARYGMDPRLAYAEPLATLAGGSWRGVGNEVVQFWGDPAESRRILWSATRVDFYSRGGGPPEPELSALYVIYPNLDASGNPAPANPANPTIGAILPPARQAGRELVTDGRANPGGQ